MHFISITDINGNALYIELSKIAYIAHPADDHEGALIGISGIEKPLLSKESVAEILQLCKNAYRS